MFTDEEVRALFEPTLKEKLADIARMLGVGQ